MYKDYHITMDSFGQECPTNWEEIADYLNSIIDSRITPDEYGDITADDHEIINTIWETYCSGDMQDAPAPVF